MAGTEASGTDGVTEAPEAMADGHTHERDCLNCGCRLVGEYCHCCGQHAHVHRTLGAFWHDLLHGVLHFEGRVWRTLPLLAWRPGELTRRYIAGERAKFVSPLALFLFSVFLMFAVVSAFGTSNLDAGGLRGDIDAAVAQSGEEVADLERNRADAARRGLATRELDARIERARENAAALRLLRERGVVGSRVTMSRQMPEWFEASVRKAAAKPDLLLYKVKNNAYKFSWALIPLSVPFLWLLFPFSRRYRLYDHSIFVTYSLGFMTLLAVLLLVALPLVGDVAMVLLLVPPWHMYRQLKGAYGLGRGAALLRTALLLMFALAAAVLFVVLLVTLGLFD